MRKYRKGLLIVVIFFLSTNGVYSQSCVSINNNTIINLPCGNTCGNINLQVPDLRTTSDYTVTNIPYSPYAFTTPGGTELSSIYIDDIYSPMINMGFNFCFYDSIFSKCVVGSNGLLTFDLANASCGNSWQQTQQIPYSSGNICSAGSAYYPRAAIMGVFTDVYPVALASPPDRKIEYRVEGTAPCRRLVVSFYHVGMFGQGNYSVGSSNCNSQNPSTFQIVLYESTGLIDVFIENKTCVATSNPGGANAILGIQNWTRTAARTAPGKNASIWTSRNEGYRFVPSGGASRLVNSQLFTLSGTPVATATTSSPGQGVIGLTFPNICPAANSEQYIVRTTYQSCADPNTLLVTDDTITINKTSTLGATTTVTNLNCTNGSSGSITVNVPPNNGVPPYQYSINGGPIQSSNVFNNLPDGTYTVVATDVNGCSSTFTETITRSGILGVGYTSINPACAGLNTGSITILPPSLYTPIQYSLNGGPSQPGNVFTNLAAGTYTISVTDAIGCSGSTFITIAQGAGINATSSTTPTSCGGANNGTITINASGGNLPYRYSLNGGPPQTSNIFTGLTAGTYSISVIDVNGCSTTLSVVVNPGTPLNATVTKTDVSCNGASDGTIIVNAANGTPPYQYSLDNVTWFTSNAFTGLAVGTYTVYYRDNNLCSNSQPVVIGQPGAINMNVTAQSPRCFGYNDGSITAIANGGTIPIRYSLDNINWQTANSFNNVTAGNYTVYCRDNNGCTSSRTITITQPPQIVATATATDATCNGGPDGQITVTASGGTSSLWYSVNSSPFAATNVFNVNPGTYYVMVADANTCVISVPALTVGLSNNLSIAAIADTTICEGSTAQLNVTSNANQFSWSQGSSLNNASIQNPVASPGVTTQYIVTATFGQCSGKDTVTVVVNPAPIADAGTDVEICYGQDHILQGAGGVQFSWTPTATLNNSSLPNPVSTPLQTTAYSLQVTDANGCTSLTPAKVVVTVTPPIIVKTNPADTVVFAGDQFQLLASSGATNYSWSPATGLSDPFKANPVLTVTSDIIFNITATTAAGCRGDGTVTIKVFKGPEIYMPTGFTPNGDGRNDVFKPFTVGVTKLNYFRVYSRWGQLLYSTVNLNEGWNGKINGLDQPTSTYVWMVQGVARDGKLITKKGTVTLIR